MQGHVVQPVLALGDGCRRVADVTPDEASQEDEAAERDTQERQHVAQDLRAGAVGCPGEGRDRFAVVVDERVLVLAVLRLLSLREMKVGKLKARAELVEERGNEKVGQHQGRGRACLAQRLPVARIGNVQGRRRDDGRVIHQMLNPQSALRGLAAALDGLFRRRLREQWLQLAQYLSAREVEVGVRLAAQGMDETAAGLDQQHQCVIGLVLQAQADELMDPGFVEPDPQALQRLARSGDVFGLVEKLFRPVIHRCGEQPPLMVEGHDIGATRRPDDGNNNAYDSDRDDESCRNDGRPTDAPRQIVLFLFQSLVGHHLPPHFCDRWRD
jgi:hypothetical protein